MCDLYFVSSRHQLSGILNSFHLYNDHRFDAKEIWFLFENKSCCKLCIKWMTEISNKFNANRNDVFWCACVSGINVSYSLYIIFFVSFFSGTIRPSLEELSRQYHSQKKSPHESSVAQWLPHFGVGFCTLASNWTVLALILHVTHGNGPISYLQCGF